MQLQAAHFDMGVLTYCPRRDFSGECAAPHAMECRMRLKRPSD
jgi:hypothetical protein